MSACPICKGPRKAATDNPTYPFCGPRCKLADLSNWMNGNYSLEAEPAQVGSQDAQDDDSQGSPTVH